MFAIRDVNTRKLLQRYVYKTASARIEVYDATKITFRTFHWYSYCYTDVPRPSRFTCEGLARETTCEGLARETSQIPLQNISYSLKTLQTVFFKPKFYINNLNITLKVRLWLVLTFENFATSAAILSSRSANTCTRTTKFGQNVLFYMAFR